MSLTASEIHALADRQWCVLPGTQDETVSDLRVLKSAAGFYVGRVEISPEGYEFPYCRESGYYPTRGWCPKMYADKRRANKKQRRHGIFEVWKLKIPFAVPVAVGRI